MANREESCRCTVCLTVFIDDEDLEPLEDEDGFFKGCGICKTDAHLIDLIEIPKEEADNG